MSIKNITITNDDGTTENFVPEVTTPVTPPQIVHVPLGVDVVLEADVPPASETL